MDTLSGNSNNINNNLSDNRQDNHGKKGSFDLHKYYEKKWNLRKKHLLQADKNSKKDNKKWQFQNCCLLTIDDKVKIKPNDVFGSLKANLSDYLEDIVAIGQFSSSKNWTVQFRNKNSYDSNLGKEISIANIKHYLKDANLFEKKEKSKPVNEYTMTVFMRIHWLPTGFKNKITEFIKDEAKFLSVIEVKSETWEEGTSKIENGVYSVKVSYDIDNHENFLNFAGFHRVDGLGALVIINGTPPKCLQCNKWGHMRKDCDKTNTKCASCNKMGHDASNCWSRQADNNENQLDMDSNDLVEDNEVQIFNETFQPNLVDPRNTPFKVPAQGQNITVEIKKELINRESTDSINLENSINSALTNAMSQHPGSTRMRNNSTSSITSNLSIKSSSTIPSKPPAFFSETTFNRIRNFKF